MVVPKFTLANYAVDGDLLQTREVVLEAAMAEPVAMLSKRFERLSGDLELPMEIDIPGEVPELVLRICSDFRAAYCIYYCQDVAVLASLFLSGTDDEAEAELQQVFKFLLLDDGEDDDLDEEMIEDVLSAEEFDMEAIEERPVAFQIPLWDEPEQLATVESIARLDQAVAAAFFQLALSRD